MQLVTITLEMAILATIQALIIGSCCSSGALDGLTFALVAFRLPFTFRNIFALTFTLRLSFALTLLKTIYLHRG